MKENPDPADAARLNELSNGVPGGLRGLVELFVSHTTEAARHLRAAANESRAADVQMLAHRGAGTAGAIGATRLVELFRKLEVLARQPGMPGLDTLVGSVEHELARVHGFLSQLTAERPRG